MVKYYNITITIIVVEYYNITIIIIVVKYYNIIIIGYCINTTFYDRGHVSDALPSLRGNALPRHERGHKMLYFYNNLIIIYPYKINRNHADT